MSLGSLFLGLASLDREAGSLLLELAAGSSRSLGWLVRGLVAFAEDSETSRFDFNGPSSKLLLWENLGLALVLLGDLLLSSGKLLFLLLPLTGVSSNEESLLGSYTYLKGKRSLFLFIWH